MYRLKDKGKAIVPLVRVIISMIQGKVRRMVEGISGPYFFDPLIGEKARGSNISVLDPHLPRGGFLKAAEITICPKMPDHILRRYH